VSDVDIGALSLQPALRNQLRSLSVLSFEAVCSAQPPSLGPNAASIDHHMAAFLEACAASSSLRELHLHQAWPSSWTGFADACLARPWRVAPEADAALAARLDDYTVGARGRTGLHVSAMAHRDVGLQGCLIDRDRTGWREHVHACEYLGGPCAVLVFWGQAHRPCRQHPSRPPYCTLCLQVEAPHPPYNYFGLLDVRRGTRHRPWEFGLATAAAPTVQAPSTGGAPLHLAMPVPTAHEALAELVAAFPLAAEQTPRPELTELWLLAAAPPSAGLLEELAAAVAPAAAQGTAAGTGAAAAGAAAAGAAPQGGDSRGGAGWPELRVDLSQHPRLRRLHLVLGQPSPGVHHAVPPDLRLLGCPPSLAELDINLQPFGWAQQMARLSAGLLYSLAEQVRAAEGEQGTAAARWLVGFGCGRGGGPHCAGLGRSKIGQAVVCASQAARPEAPHPHPPAGPQPCRPAHRRQAGPHRGAMGRPGPPGRPQGTRPSRQVHWRHPRRRGRAPVGVPDRVAPARPEVD
jgi:hypothetical protein